MGLADVPPDALNADAAKRALADGEREGLRTEYKRHVGEDGAEWALDVTSFANTAGGVLLVGAEETDGRLSGLPGVTGPVDDEIQRLESTLRDRVDPSMPGVALTPLDVDGATLVVVHVPRSWRGPHLVRRGSRWQLARRNSSGKYPLQDVSEVRAAFAESLDVESRARRWHEDRVVDVEGVEVPTALPPGPFIVMTVQPLAAVSHLATHVLDVAAARSNEPHNQVRPLYGGGDGPRVNLDGLIAVARGGDGRARGFTQLYRTGSLAYVDNGMFERGEGVPGSVLVDALVGAVYTSVGAVEWAGASLPVVVQASLHGVADRLLHTRASGRSFDDYMFDRDRVVLPSVVIDHAPADRGDAARALRPMLDGLWNAVGAASCEHFDADGNWVPPR